MQIHLEEDKRNFLGYAVVVVGGGGRVSGVRGQYQHKKGDS